jgi:serine/threonine protein kinase
MNNCKNGCEIPTMMKKYTINRGSQSIISLYTKKSEKYIVKTYNNKCKHHGNREYEYGELLRKYDCFVKIYFLYECKNGHINLIIEYIEGKTLQDIIDYSIYVDILSMKKIIYQILRALNILNQHKILHNDLKPSNIMISKEGKIKIIDFGMMNPYFLPGTNVYKDIFSRQMPSQNFTSASDIWCLGRIIYDITNHIKIDPLQSYKKYNKYHPLKQEELNNFIQLCMKENPKERKTPEELLTILSAI